MKSSAFLRFLEALTGIAALIPDPQFRGSGLHFVGPGGRLAVHADFARYEQRAEEARTWISAVMSDDQVPDVLGSSADVLH